jgi:tetratricopeptide (TPR) repeat protein
MTEQQLRQEIACGSQDPQVFCELAELAWTAGQVGEAISLYRRALSLPLTGLEKGKLSTTLGWLLYETARVAEALPLAENATETLSKEASTPEVLALRGASEALRAHCMFFTDEKAGAEAGELGLRYLREVMVDAPDFAGIADVYYGAARISNLLWRATDTIEFCEKCLQCELAEKQRLQCLLVLAEAFRQEEQFGKAERALEEALNLVRTDVVALPRLYMEMGMVKRLTNVPDEARRFFEQALVALESHPYSRHDSTYLTQIYGNLGELDYETERYEDAVAAFQKVLSYHPVDNVERRGALLWLAQTYHGMRAYDDARHCYEQILNSPLALEAERASAQEGLGKVYYDQEEYVDAAAAFEESIRIFSEESSFHCNALLWLGYSYLAMGSDSRARECLEKVITSKHAPDADVSSATEALSRILSGAKKTLH